MAVFFEPSKRTPGDTLEQAVAKRAGSFGSDVTPAIPVPPVVTTRRAFAARRMIACWMAA
jgi:hypothetical protein